MISKTNRKKISIFQLLVLLIALAAVIAFYINNIIAVNQLIGANSELKDNIDKTVQLNYSYRIEIERLSNFERIKTLAAEKFNMRMPDNSKGENKTMTIKKSLF